MVINLPAIIWTNCLDLAAHYKRVLKSRVYIWSGNEAVIALSIRLLELAAFVSFKFLHVVRSKDGQEYSHLHHLISKSAQRALLPSGSCHAGVGTLLLVTRAIPWKRQSSDYFTCVLISCSYTYPCMLFFPGKLGKLTLEGHLLWFRGSGIFFFSRQRTVPIAVCLCENNLDPM